MAGLNWINHMYHDLRFIELLVRRKWDKLDKCNTNYRHLLAHVFINRDKLQRCHWRLWDLSWIYQTVGKPVGPFLGFATMLF